MSRYIDAYEYEKRIKPYDTEDKMDKALYNFAHNVLICCSSADVKPIVYGEWIITKDKYGTRCKCDYCGSEWYLEDNKVLEYAKICPMCGSENMRKESKE